MSIADKLETIVKNVPKVYQAGKDAEWNEFWDRFQNYGNRAIYLAAFTMWMYEYIRPKYKVIPTKANSRNQTFSGCDLLKAVEKKYFDFSQCPIGTSNTSAWYYTFYECFNLEIIEDVGINNSYGFYATFANCQKLHTIECIYPDEKTMFSETFNYCYELINLRVNGAIGKDGFNVRWSKKLSKESHISIINALSTTTSGLSVTFSNTAVNKAFETASEANDGSTSAEWLALIATRSNWTIALA